MTETTMTTLDRSDSWTQLGASDPEAITIKCNSPGTWHLAIAASAPAADFEGEVYKNQFEPWLGGGITGNVYVRVEGDGMSFAVTE